jgi:hypothetical protein
LIDPFSFTSLPFYKKQTAVVIRHVAKTKHIGNHSSQTQDPFLVSSTQTMASSRILLCMFLMRWSSLILRLKQPIVVAASEVKLKCMLLCMFSSQHEIFYSSFPNCFHYACETPCKGAYGTMTHWECLELNICCCVYLME